MSDPRTVEAPAVDPPAPARRGWLVWVVAAVVLAGAGGGAAWWLRVRTHTAAAAPAVAEPVRATVPLGAVVVNLAGEPKRYVRVAVSIGVTDPKHVREVEDARPQLLDLLISVVATAPGETLATEDGRAAMKTALLTRARDELALRRAARVYITEFVIQ